MVIHHIAGADITFQGKDPEEKFMFFFRQHWIRLLRPLVRMLLEAAGIILAFYLTLGPMRPDDPTLLHAIVLLLCVLFWGTQLEFLVRFYRHFLYVAVVTNRKIHRIKKTFLTVDDHETIDLQALQDIRKAQHGPIQNMFGFGSLILEAQNTKLKLHFVPRIGRTYNQLMTLRERVRETHPSSHRV